jgi:hypothetical protein
MKIGLFTIASKNYLPYARVLFQSVERIHPEYRRILCLVDEVDGYFDPKNERFEVVLASQLGIDAFPDMKIRYDIMELNTAVKPFMIEWLFNQSDLDAVIYLDPDIRVYERFDYLESKIVAGASVLLTPHITRPVEDASTPNDYHMLQSGVFNLGFVAVRRCPEAFMFLRWWGRRLKTQCAADFSVNLFTDQRWCDLAPCFLDNLIVIKKAGYNVAYWNLMQRAVSRDESGSWRVDGDPLVFFHFSGVNADDPRSVSKHQNRFDWDDLGQVNLLFQGYVDSLFVAGWNFCKTWPYAYSTISGSFPLVNILRKFYRNEYPESRVSSDSSDLAKHLQSVCNIPAVELPNFSGVIISRLMVFIYRSRNDLQKSFDLNCLEGQKNYSYWFAASACREYGLPEIFTDQKIIKEFYNQRLEKKN